MSPGTIFPASMAAIRVVLAVKDAGASLVLEHGCRHSGLFHHGPAGARLPRSTAIPPSLL